MKMRIVKDMDFENSWSWQGVLDMVMVLTDRASDQSFAYREMGGWKLPSVEFRLDHPEELSYPQIERTDHTEKDKWSRGTVILSDEIPEVPAEGNVWYMRRNGAAAIAYRAFRETVRAYRALGGKIEFVWSSIPLSPVAGDIRLTEKREQALYSKGAIHTVWIHEESDDMVTDRMKRLPPCGEFRVQNMTTANTWIIGNTDDEGLIEYLKRA